MRENREKWMELCEQAATEQDPEKLMELISQINPTVGSQGATT
jgi:hypothetical protein